MNIKNLLPALALLLPAAAHSQLKIDAEIRPRFEFRNGYRTLRPDHLKPALVTSQRTRLNLGYTSEKYTLFISVQDARTWGETAPKADVASMNLFEGWVLYRFTDNLAMKAGRQSVTYGNGHLLGPSDWNNAGCSHDLAMLKYEKEGWSVDLAGGYSNNSDKNFESNYPINSYKYLSYLWAEREISPSLSVSTLNILDGYQKEKSNDTIYTRGTSGLNVSYRNDSSPLSANLLGCYQYGKSGGGTRVSAYFFSITPTLNVSPTLRATLALDHFSGDDALNPNNEDNAFSNLYGTGHGLYGYMDYFTAIDRHTKNGGLADLYLRLSYSPTRVTNLEATVHNFRLTNTVIDTITTPGVPAKAKRNLGTEIDLMVKHKLSSAAELRFGFSTMLATKSMEVLKGGNHAKFQCWGWMMFIYKPTLFKSEKR